MRRSSSRAASIAATGYPQVGGSKLHIAHVLYGGLLLLAALIATLAFLSPATRSLTPVVGGIGFGLFIDEVGKFVTKNVNYFYRPAIAIIYVCFVVLFGIIRWLSRRRFTGEEATLIGLEALQRAVVGSLSAERRTRVLGLLRASPDADPLARSVCELLERSAAAPASPSFSHRLSQRLAARWVPLTRRRLFRRAVFAALIAAAAISGGETAWLLRDGFGGASFSQRAFVLTTLAADLMLAIGAIRLTRSLLSALHWYDHAVLLEITVGQVFYASEQLAATLDLVALLALWGLIRWAVQLESAQTPIVERGLRSR
ncbi:MAG: hypothetical protein ACYDBR_14550 [Gaiellaceae bacterium]